MAVTLSLDDGGLYRRWVHRVTIWRLQAATGRLEWTTIDRARVQDRFGGGPAAESSQMSSEWPAPSCKMVLDTQ